MSRAIPSIELWRTDGTPEGTRITKDLKAGSGTSLFLPTNLFDFDGTLFFGAESDRPDFGNWGIDLHVSDGTSAGTGLAFDINPLFRDSRPNNFVAIGDQLFFYADNASVSCIDLNGRVLATASGGGQSSLSLNGNFLPHANGTYVVSIVTTTGERAVGRIIIAR